MHAGIDRHEVCPENRRSGMTTVLVMTIMAFFVAMAATRVAIGVAPSIGLMDHPDGVRKLHAGSIPKLGGPAIYLGILIPAWWLAHVSGSTTTVAVLFREFTGPLLAILSGGTIALCMGLLDDFFDLRPRWKLLGQFIVAVIMYQSGMGIRAISSPLGGSIELGLLGFPVTLLWFMGCMNAVNLMDGLDGLAAGICLFVGITLFLVSLHFNNLMGMVLLAVLNGAILGFLVFNFPPARIFLGDSGSMLLGFLVASFSLLGASRKAEAAVALFIPIVALGLPIMDTAVAIIRRWYQHLPISTPDRKHIHHRLVAMGYSQQRAVLVLYAVSVVMAGFAVLITFGRNEVVILVVAALTIITFTTVRIFSGVQLLDVWQKLKSDKETHQRMVRVNNVLDIMTAEIGKAATVDKLWEACKAGFEKLEVDQAGISLRLPAGEDFYSWRRSGAPSGRGLDGWTFRLNLRDGDRSLGQLEVEKYDFMMPEACRFMERLRNAIQVQIPLCREFAESGQQKQ